MLMCGLWRRCSSGQFVGAVGAAAETGLKAASRPHSTIVEYGSTEIMCQQREQGVLEEIAKATRCQVQVPSLHFALDLGLIVDLTERRY